jgi:transcriptional regulator with XRE-family HTH domain
VTKIKDKNHPAILTLKDYQLRKGLNREDLADRAGIGLGTLNKLMSGDIPTDSTLRTIEQNLQVRLLTSFQMVAHQDLGAYPKSWADDLEGEYLVVRQNRWLTQTEVINTYPARFSWDPEKPGLRIDWSNRVDKHYVRRQAAHVSMTSREGLVTIVRMDAGRISTTQLQRYERRADRLVGIWCGMGEVNRGHEAIVTQVVAYVRRSTIDVPYDDKVIPGAPAYQFFAALLSQIEGSYCHTIPPMNIK